MHLPDIKSNRSVAIWLAVSALFLVSVALIRSYDWYQPGSAIGYNLGLVGGVLMLLLLVYPLKKRVKALQRFGSTRPWFVFHMVCGVVGPLAVMYHSTFRIGSQNALVATVSMLIVAGSGIVGRFIYVRIHNGLSGQELKLDELEGDEHSESINLNRDMHWAPDVVKALTDFRAWVNQPAANGLAATLKFLAVPLKDLRLRWTCHRLLAVQLDQRARIRGWEPAKRKLRGRQFDALVAHYSTTVMRYAQYSVYKKLFSWWHILHLPFVYLLAASAIYHVVAVHMY